MAATGRRGFLAFLLLLCLLAAWRGRRPPPSWAASPPPPSFLDPNRAALDDWMLLPGIGPARARAILEERARGGAFANEADLARRLPELGLATRTRIGPFLVWPAAGL